MGAPAWMSGREELWNAVEAAERRTDTQLAREVEFALPTELEDEQAVALAREFVQREFVHRGMVADLNIHLGGHNPYANAMLTMREVTTAGFGRKVREWNGRSCSRSGASIGPIWPTSIFTAPVTRCGSIIAASAIRRTRRRPRPCIWGTRPARCSGAGWCMSGSSGWKKCRASSATRVGSSGAAMAIYHFQVKIISRSQGRSAVAAAAYRSASEIHDQRQGQSFDYSDKPNVVHSEIMLPAGAPAWMADRAQLWNAVELGEQRKDSQVAREVEFAIPQELSQAGRNRAGAGLCAAGVRVTRDGGGPQRALGGR